MDNKSFEMLEFPKVREILTGFTSFSASCELVENLLPSTNVIEVSRLLKQSAEARQFLAWEADFSIGRPVDVRDAVGMASLGKVLDPQTLLDVRSTVATANNLSASFRRLADDFPNLWSIAQQIVVLPYLEEEIARCIDPAGEILDSASARLAEVRYELKDSHRQLMNRLEGILRSESVQPMLQESLITDRGGRYVIPIKTEFQVAMKGIIHDVSNTGATVFIEPLLTVELGNNLRQLALEEDREIQRILAGLSEEIAENSEDLGANVGLIAQLDVVLAKAKYARSVNAAEPQITDSEKPGSLKLVDARHPLLKGRVVPLSVEVGADFSGLIITGPNTGGKTVALKTMGLLALMAQSGIPIPASEGSQIPIFDNVFADIGDEQSIEETLSSFSWHMGNIVRIIRMSTHRSLVLLDELGTSTDPAEGAALARSILLHFVKKETLVVATTHFGELKVFAHTTPGLQNSSMEFDSVTLAPTYHMVPGVPGGSNALAIASQLGLPPDIIDSAREVLPKGTPEMESLLTELSSAKEAARAERTELAKEREVVAGLKKQAEEALEALEVEKQDIILKERVQITTEAAELRKQIRQASSELKKAKSKQKIEQAGTIIDSVRERLESEPWRTPPSRDAAEIESISVGDAVRIIDTNIRGTVMARTEKTGEIEIQAGKTKFKVSVEDVEKIEITDEAAPLRSHTLKMGGEQRHHSLELDLRGKRAEEVEPDLDAYLNDVSIAGFHEVRIIHGYGTGTVRQIVRDMLASHPLIRSFRSGKHEEGGDGVTVAIL